MKFCCPVCDSTLNEAGICASHGLQIIKPDLINHPPHYKAHPSGIECIEITRHMNFNCGNAIKYIWRNGLKEGTPSIQDLEKAIWYIKDEIKRITK